VSASGEDPLYHLHLRPGEAPAASAEDVARRLPSIPQVQAAGPGLFRFGEGDEDGVMELRLRGEPLQSVEVTIPRAWVMERGPQVFALVFMVQGWTGYEVYDPQIDDTLQREAVLQGLVAMRQARRDQEGGRVPEPELNEPASGPHQASQDRLGRPLRPAEDEDDEAPRRKSRWRFW